MFRSGLRLFSGYLDETVQRALLTEVLQLAAAAPFYRPSTPSGKPMSVAQTCLGPLGWVTDKRGYRYEPCHPVTGQPWPPMPAVLLALWAALGDRATPPDACLVNRYDAVARMGLHQDKDEADFGFPVLSVSLGDTAIFRIGGTRRSDPTATVRLGSGDVCVLAGGARLAYHGVDRILSGSSRLVPGGGRINLTLRRAAPSPSWGGTDREAVRVGKSAAARTNANRPTPSTLRSSPPCRCCASAVPAQNGEGGQPRSFLTSTSRSRVN